VCGGRKKRKHPDDEEVVWDHTIHLGQTDDLNADACEHLLVAEGEEEFARDFGGEEGSEDDERREEERAAGGDNEGEKDLGVVR